MSVICVLLHVYISAHYRCIKLLCKYNADIKERVYETQDTALHIAARNDHLEILKLLLSQGLDPELR